jgi:hypothetical protein
VDLFSKVMSRNNMKQSWISIDFQMFTMGVHRFSYETTLDFHRFRCRSIPLPVFRQADSAIPPSHRCYLQHVGSNTSVSDLLVWIIIMFLLLLLLLSSLF